MPGWSPIDRLLDSTLGRPPGVAVRWQNFRGFGDTGWRPIAPITVVIGSNNSGKTAFHAPLLLLKQTMQSADESQALITNGDLINAGSYQELIFRHRSRLPLVFGIRWVGDPRGIKTLPSRLPPGAVEMTFGVGRTTPEKIVLKTFRVLDPLGKSQLTRALLADGRFGLRFSSRVGPSALQSKTEGEKRANATVSRAIRADTPNHFLFAPDVLLDALVTSNETRRSRSSLILPQLASNYLLTAGVVYSIMNSLLRGLSYLGPLRHRPQRLYQLSGEVPPDVGLQGEFAPELLYRNPALLRATRKWFRRFGLAQNVTCEKIGNFAFSLYLQRTPTSPEINFADSGFGASQLLPLIVEALHGREHSLTIAEQPEIHLNPRLQTSLADLFVEMAKSGRSILVETHSEHLVVRLRRLIAEKRIAAKDVALYYVEKDQDESRIRQVSIKANGHIEADEWPKDFFGEGLDEAMGLAAAQLRAKRRARRPSH